MVAYIQHERLLPFRQQLEALLTLERDGIVWIAGCTYFHVTKKSWQQLGRGTKDIIQKDLSWALSETGIN